ncbi:tetratricopeptide repeat protein [Sulfitobacter sp. LCG007]
MSQSDSFIEEVNDELRRERLFATFRRYGWLALLVIVLIVGGAAWHEYRKSQDRAAAERLGDELLAAMAEEDGALRSQTLAEIAAPSAEARAVVSLLAAGSAVQAGDTDQAVAELDAAATDGEVPEIYRQIAAFKALLLQAESLDPGALRGRLEGLAQPGSPIRLLCEEQIALLDIREGKNDEAIARYQNILQDAELTPDLQQRALQVIVALGGTPELLGQTAPDQ